MEPSWIETIRVTNWSRQVHQTQRKCGLKCQTNLGKVVGGKTHKIRGIKIDYHDSCGGKALEAYHRSPLTVIAALVPLAQQMAKRSRPFTDEASKYTGALSKSKPVGRRVLALQQRDRLQFPGITRNSRVTEPEASHWEDYYWMPKDRKMLRRHLYATSTIIPMSWRHRETGCSQK